LGEKVFETLVISEDLILCCVQVVSPTSVRRPLLPARDRGSGNSAHEALTGGKAKLLLDLLTSACNLS